MTPDWKGEALIRIPRNPNAGRGFARHRQIKKPPAMKVECAFPGCGKMIHAGGTSGVCRKHQHRAGVCKCTQCKARE